MRDRFRFRRFCVMLAGSLCAFSSLAYADTIDRDDDQDIDVQALREWINTKRQVTVKEIGGNLSISGEVRTEFQATGETVNGVKQRGRGAPLYASGGNVYPNRGYDIEVNLMLDYRTDRTWSAIKLEFDNDAGIFGGTFNKIKLEKAYFGGRVVDADSWYIDVELGRRRLSNIFDSMLEFNAFFDGILFEYDQSWEKVGDFYTNLGVFVIDERKDQYGYVGELGLLNIANTGLYSKFSLIDWDTKHFASHVDNLRFDFIVGQLILGYRFYPQKLQKQVTLYSAALYNFAANRLEITNNTKANWGGYVGFSIGELKKQGDWAINMNYQVLQAQCVPDFDNGGIGMGNVSNAGLYTADINGTGAPTTRKTAAGNGNYRGFVVTLDYLITSNLNLQQQWQQSITLDKEIGPFRRFKQYEIEFIYGF